MQKDFTTSVKQFWFTGVFIRDEVPFLQRYKSISKFCLPTDAQKICFKRILKFALKQLLHVSVQSPSSGSVLFELIKVIVIKIIS